MELNFAKENIDSKFDCMNHRAKVFAALGLDMSLSYVLQKIELIHIRNMILIEKIRFIHQFKKNYYVWVVIKLHKYWWLKASDESHLYGVLVTNLLFVKRAKSFSFFVPG